MIYPYKTYILKVNGERFWVAESEVLPGCVGQGNYLGEAVKELEENEIIWLKTAKEESIRTLFNIKNGGKGRC